MRRITSFFALLAMLLVSTSAFAQDEPQVLEELDMKTFSISEQVTEIVPNTWYLLYQQRDNGGYLFDPGVGARLLKSKTEAVADEGNPTRTMAKYLVRFIEAESTEENPEYPAYYLQFGTGNWVSYQNDSNEQPGSTDDEDNRQAWNVGQVSEDEPGHFWFNVDYLGRRIDNDSHSGATATIAYWESGPGTATGSNYDWAIYSIEFTETSELEMKYTETLSRYEELLEQYDAFEIGTGHGQYPEEKVLAFQAALDLVGATLDDASYEPTVESLQGMLDLMNTTYQDLVDSQIILTFDPANGYYFVKSGAGDKFWYETTTTEDTEDPETGEIIPGETITTYHQKAMFSDATGAGWKEFVEDEADATFLFRIDKDETTGNYKFESVATGGRIPKIAQSSGFSALDPTLDPVESEIKFYYNSKDSLGNVIFAIRRADQTGDYQFLHQNNHGGGSGKSGNFCGWAQTPGASSWMLISVTDAKAQELLEAYGPIKEHAILVQKYDSIKAVAKAELPIAEDFAVDMNTPLVSDASQFSSEFTEPNEGSIEALLDGDYSSFWHSNWSDGTAPQGTHYLQVTLPDAQSFGIAMAYGRRTGAADDHTTKFSVYGSETGEGSKEEWTYLGELLYPDLVLNQMLVASCQFEGAWQNIRVYSEETKNINTGALKNRGYWHASEIQFYPVSNNPNSQAAKLGKLYTDLKSVLAEQEGLESEDITPEIYNELKTALDAFNAKFVNPADLRAAIAEASSKATYVVEGTDPGYWSDLSGKTALEGMIDTASAYDKSGDYTKEQSDAYTNQLLDATAYLMLSANSVREDKWYFIQFPSEEMYDTYEWDKAGAEEKYNDDEQKTMDALYETVVVLAKHRAGNGSDESASASFVDIIGADEAYQGQLIACDLLEDLADEDLAKFRFVNVGDTAYALQNKATGLYISMVNTVSANTVADLQPTLFKPEAIGAGVNLLKNEDISGAQYSYMHFQHSGSKVVSWNASTLGCNSALLIKEAEDITDLPGNSFMKQTEAGKVYPMCYATSFKVTDGDASLYTVRGINEDLGTYSVVLTPATEAKAGQPVVLVADGEYMDPGKEEPMYDEITMEHGTSFVHDPIATPVIKGSFEPQTAPKGSIVAKGGTFECPNGTTSIAARSAYFVFEGGSVDAEEGDLVVEVGGKGKIVDSIDEVMNKVAANGAIYGVDGRLVGNGNINNVRALGKGTYIVNGVKVLVK